MSAWASEKIRPLAPEAAPLELLLLADPERAAIERYLSKSQVFALRAGDERIVGVIVLTPLPAPDEIEIKNIAVAEDQQGQGLGRALLSFAVAEARRQGMRAIEIGTGNSSLGQLALYQKTGFRMHRIDRDFFTRNYAAPIFENGIQCRDMVILRLEL